MGELAEKSPDHASNGKFLPGHKAHKATRRKRIPATILRDACSDEDLQLLLEMGLDRAKAGDDQWLGFFINRMTPTVKPTSPVIKFPLDTSSPTTAIQDVLAAVASGSIPPDQGKDLISSVHALAQVQELEDMQLQIKELADMLGNQ